VILRSGNGAIVVNELPIETFFPQRTHRLIIGEPLEVTNNTNKVDIQVNVSGGGISGQADAIRHGIARALVKLDVTNTSTLRANGMLTRDPRMVERKKYGRSGARKRFQFSKR